MMLLLLYLAGKNTATFFDFSLHLPTNITLILFIAKYEYMLYCTYKMNFQFTFILHFTVQYRTMRNDINRDQVVSRQWRSSKPLEILWEYSVYLFLSVPLWDALLRY
jgi:hypothetical protein